MYLRLYLIFLLTLSFNAFSQGKLMLVGGGSEKDAAWGWSNIPYQWAVEQAPNHRVAIISYAESSDPSWLPDYFISLGADEAVNFVIPDRQAALEPTLFNALTAYDLIFFKGGDQSVYYAAYRDTELSRAVGEVYARGGVIAGTSAGMAILTSIVYTAEKESVYPDQVLGGDAPGLITLRNDMFDFLPGYLGDTHFAERGRLPRLLAFTGEAVSIYGFPVTGIGVDDQTAFCIAADNTASVYGTGAVTVVKVSAYGYGQDKKPEAQAEIISLLHGQRYDLTAGQPLTNYTTNTSAPEVTSSVQADIYLTGSEAYSHNRSLWEQLLMESAKPVVIAGPDNALIRSYADAARESGKTVTMVEPDVTADSCLSVPARNQLRDGALVLITGNSPEGLLEFMAEHATGEVLKNALFHPETTVMMAGDNAMLAGALRVTNIRSEPLNAYQGNLAFDSGLGVIPSAIVITETYDPASADFYENTTAAGIYPMIRERLRTAIYLNERSWLRIYTDNGSVQMKPGGDYAAMIVSNESEFGELASQPVNDGGDYRNVAGFDQITLRLAGSEFVEAGPFIPDDYSLGEKELLPPGDLSAGPEETGIRIRWNYYSGEGNGFELDRSVNGGAFSQIAVLAADVRSYTDEDISVNTSYAYRIRRTGPGGNSCYAETAAETIITSQSVPEDGAWCFPNPATGALNIRSAGLARYILTDMRGYRYEEGAFSGQTRVDVSGLPVGIYLLRLWSGNQVRYNKIHVQPTVYTLTGN